MWTKDVVDVREVHIMDKKKKKRKEKECYTQVPWTKDRVDMFIEMAMLDDDEAYIIRSRVHKIPVSVQARYLDYSESTIHAMVRKLKLKYDVVQRQVNDPKIFPPRKFSKDEVWMDLH